MCLKCFPLASTHALRRTRHWSVAWSTILWWMSGQSSIIRTQFQLIHILNRLDKQRISNMQMMVNSVVHLVSETYQIRAQFRKVIAKKRRAPCFFMAQGAWVLAWRAVGWQEDGLAKTVLSPRQLQFNGRKTLRRYCQYSSRIFRISAESARRLTATAHVHSITGVHSALAAHGPPAAGHRA